MEFSPHFVRNILNDHRDRFARSSAPPHISRCVEEESDDDSGGSASPSPHSPVYHASVTSAAMYYSAREAMGGISPRTSSPHENDAESVDSQCERSPRFDVDQSFQRPQTSSSRDKGPDSMSPIRQGLDYKRFLADKKLYHCHQCKYVTDRKNNLKRHIVTMHEKCTKVLECCELVFPNKAALREHVLSCHKNGYNCRICGRSFCRKALLKRHVTVHSGQKDYICGICGYATSHKSNLDRHRRRHEQKAALPSGMGLQALQASPYSGTHSHPYKQPLCESNCFGMFMDMDERWKETFHELQKLSTLYSGVKQRFRSSSRHMFPNRLLFTHDRAPSPTRPSPDSPEQTSDAMIHPDVARNETLHNTVAADNEDSRPVAEAGEEEEEERVSRISSAMPLPPRLRWRLSHQPSTPRPSHRLVPTLYRCGVCDVVFRTQLDLSEHGDACKITAAAPPPQRPLTLEARKRDLRSLTHRARWL